MTSTYSNTTTFCNLQKSIPLRRPPPQLVVHINILLQFAPISKSPKNDVTSSQVTDPFVQKHQTTQINVEPPKNSPPLPSVPPLSGISANPSRHQFTRSANQLGNDHQHKASYTFRLRSAIKMEFLHKDFLTAPWELQIDWLGEAKLTWTLPDQIVKIYVQSTGVYNYVDCVFSCSDMNNGTT